MASGAHMQEEWKEYLYGGREMWKPFVTGPVDQSKVLCAHRVPPWFFEITKAWAFTWVMSLVSKRLIKVPLIFGPLTAR